MPERKQLKVKRFPFLSTVDTRLSSALLLAILLFLPRPSMGGVPDETSPHDRQNRLIGSTSPTTEATYASDALDRRIAKTVDGETEAFVCGTSAVEALVHHGITRTSFAIILTRLGAQGDGARRPSRYHPGDHV